MINDVTFGEVGTLPGVDVINFYGGGPNFPYQAFRMARGKLCVSGAQCVPVIDNATSLMAFTDIHPLKSRYLLSTSLEATQRIENALILPAIDNYYHFLIYRLGCLALLPDLAAYSLSTLATVSTVPARVAPTVEALVGERSAVQPLARCALPDGVYDAQNIVIGQSRNPWFGAFFNRTFILPILLQRAGALEAIASATPLKLFVRRNAVTRRLINQSDIETLLLARGYTPIDPGALEFHEQAVLFARATHIIGVEGSAMTNLVFAVRAVAVTILANPDTASDMFFTDLVERFGVTANVIAGNFVAGAKQNRSSDFIVPLAVIEDLGRT